MNDKYEDDDFMNEFDAPVNVNKQQKSKINVIKNENRLKQMSQNARTNDVEHDDDFDNDWNHESGSEVASKAAQKHRKNSNSQGRPSSKQVKKKPNRSPRNGSNGPLGVGLADQKHLNLNQNNSQDKINNYSMSPNFVTKKNNAGSSVQISQRAPPPRVSTGKKSLNSAKQSVPIIQRNSISMNPQLFGIRAHTPLQGMEHVRLTQSAERILNANNKLKSELLEVIETMEGQLERVEQKRQDRISVEKEAKHAQHAYLRDVAKGTKKKEYINKEIEEMWDELEGRYQNGMITEMENVLRARKGKLFEIYTETQDYDKVRQEQNKLLEEKDEKKGENDQRMSALNEEVREANYKVKVAKHEQRDMMAEIKQNHTEVLRMEEKTKSLANLIKSEKEKKGEHKKKIMIERGQAQEEKLKMDVSIIEENKKDDDRAMKAMLKDLDEQIRQMEQEVKIAELKMKEKDDDSKMMDLKIKELMKQVPGYKLKPAQDLERRPQPKRKQKDRSNPRIPSIERPVDNYKGGNAFLTQNADIRDDTVQGNYDYQKGAMVKSIKSNSGYSDNFSDEQDSKFQREETPDASPMSYEREALNVPIQIKQQPQGFVKKPTLFSLNKPETNSKPTKLSPKLQTLGGLKNLKQVGSAANIEQKKAYQLPI